MEAEVEGDGVHNIVLHTCGCCLVQKAWPFMPERNVLKQASFEAMPEPLTANWLQEQAAAKYT